MRRSISNAGASMVSRLLRSSANLRAWTVQTIESRYFADLHLQVDLGHDLHCPLLSRESWGSFAETFVRRALGGLFAAIPAPDRWLDLGCHYGFFSLAAELARRQAGHSSAPAQALLVDADPRALPAVRKLIEVNHLAPGVKVLHRAIGTGAAVTLFERAGMGSSLFGYPRAGGRPITVPTLNDEEVLCAFPSGIDLVKVDVEGAETIFFEKHRLLLENARFLAIEWHSWAGGGSDGRDLVRKLWQRSGFRHLATVEEPRILLIDGKEFSCGTEALARA